MNPSPRTTSRTFVHEEWLPHPRLFARPERWDELRENLHSTNCDGAIALVFQTLCTVADQLLTQPPVERVMTGRRLLGISREALMRISTLAAVARLTRKPAYLGRAIQELEAVSAFSDWNPSHFLDVGEMALAVAIGYDWLYDDLSDEQRARFEQALLDHAINISFADPKAWWITSDNNWNQVCHAGLVVAALAIGDRHPALAATVVNRALQNLPLAAKAYAPAGVYAEGPMYWSYGSSYHVILADALLQATGDTHGVDAYPGFLTSAEFLLQVTGPTGTFYNYGDTRQYRGLQLPLFWMAARCNRPAWVEYDLLHLDEYLGHLHTENSRLLALFLFWHRPTGLHTGTPPAQGHWAGMGSNPVAVFRASKHELYFAIKGGSPDDSHAHMDGGSFILESDRVRWAIDLGMQEYHSLESAGLEIWERGPASDRWKVFRIGSESHNIPRFNNAPQIVTGRARFIQLEPEKGFATLDLSELYSDQVDEARRGVRQSGNSILLQDEWRTGPTPATVTWQLLTEAEIETRPNGWLLHQNGQQLSIRVEGPQDTTLSHIATDTLIRDYDQSNPKTKRLGLTVQTPAHSAGRFTVIFTPGGATEDLSAPPLNEWH